MSRLTEYPFVLHLLLAAIAGVLIPLSFSPYNIWLLQPLSTALFYILLAHRNPSRAAWIGFSYGLGLFGAGASWIHVSIRDFGNAGPVLSLIITVGFVAIMALFITLQAWSFSRFIKAPLLIPGFAALWVVCEWFRGWFLTGFPWLYLGYAHTGSMFAGLAPVFGVLGISFTMALSGALLGAMASHYLVHRSPYALAGTHLPTILLFLWGLASLSNRMQWIVERTDDTVTVGMVQGNIEQSLKFRVDYLQDSLDVYNQLSTTLWHNELVIWPETAIPLVYQNAGDILQYFGQQASGANATLVSGIFYRNEVGAMHNSVVTLGNGEGIWHKQKLVPFGEYVPLASVLGTVLQIFNLPMSSLQPGPPGQTMLSAGPYSIAPFICYEIVYPDFVRRYGQQADILLTVSNDTWFGASLGPLQHLQMAAMRSLEMGKSMARATNNGVSALIDGHGHIFASTPQFESAILQGELPLYTGRTFFSRWGTFPVILLCGLIILINIQPAFMRRFTAGIIDDNIKK